MTAHTDLSELPQELPITEEYNSERQDEAGGEEGDDVAVTGQIVGIPVQGWGKDVLLKERDSFVPVRGTNSTRLFGQFPLCKMSF